METVKERLRFRVCCSAEEVATKYAPLLGKANAYSWMERAPGTCRLAGISSMPTPHGAPVVLLLVVECRPGGWKLRVTNKTPDGQLLDGKGRPLPEGQAPVVLEFERCAQADFRGVDFGKLVGADGAVPAPLN